MINNILLKKSGVKAFSWGCCNCKNRNILYLADSHSSKNAVGARCLACQVTIWCDGRNDLVLNELTRPPEKSGEQYVSWRKKVIDKFLQSFGGCLNCGDKAAYELVTNKPSKETTCLSCGKINMAPKLEDVTIEHENDELQWRS
ncbi:hypothetical protein [Marinagarivorans cellulosilyticus]|uniref:Uncharacterized protein n=1 Tax=Marinagarivorans cellulosilyticus TaxID=2721545 RepID=A0AAN1WJL8_9GAMM|nr:hypothetical protein [Marinagarivorans cellulosilyticus]BCD98843.1 hypothetical protein MARGE09_P3044 [Marinagarivorans cellulosilyticus]